MFFTIVYLLPPLPQKMWILSEFSVMKAYLQSQTSVCLSVRSDVQLIQILNGDTRVTFLEPTYAAFAI